VPKLKVRYPEKRTFVE
jgi:hypothetical protein